ncbi:hypothetical protein ABBQ38_008595 [Trebouxia sp. C0009 RCD-2024]
MGYVPICCHICEGPLDFQADEVTRPVDDYSLPEAIRKAPVLWLADAVGIPGGNLLYNRQGCSSHPVEANEPLALEPWDEEGGFDVKGTGDLYFAPYDDHGNLQNLACHRACYSLLGKEFRYKLKLSDVQHLAKGDFQAHLMTSDYGGIFKYQYQARTLWMCARMCFLNTYPS